jgi:hypothetical protein
MVIITYFKPNLLIQSDSLISGHIEVYDKKNHHRLWSVKIIQKDFVTIKVLPGWPGQIEVEVDTGRIKNKKEIYVGN